MKKTAEKFSRKKSAWAIVVVVIVLAYLVLQPMANQHFGWRLPSLAGLLENQPNGIDDTLEQPQPAALPSTTKGNQAATGPRENQDSGPELLHGILQDLGREEYVSPAGLRYTRGSAEGHRLKHLARHLQDQPDRPGSHGVFTAELPQVLQWLDDAYERAIEKHPGTTSQTEGNRIVYEVTFEQVIGYVGGQSGARRNRPATKQLRMVVEKDRLITAFPF